MADDVLFLEVVLKIRGEGKRKGDHLLGLPKTSLFGCGTTARRSLKNVRMDPLLWTDTQ